MHRKSTAKYLFIIGIGLMTFSCSIRKTDKEKYEEKRTSEYQEKTKENIQLETSISEKSLIEKTDFSQWFNFDFKPIFDQNGKIIPFIIEQTKNGQTEKLVISGANVTGSQSNSKESQKKEAETKITYKLVTVTNTNTYNITKTKYQTKTKERFSFGPQSIYAILLCGLTILFAALAFTGHWQWIKNVFEKLLSFIKTSK